MPLLFVIYTRGTDTELLRKVLEFGDSTKLGSNARFPAGVRQLRNIIGEITGKFLSI